MTAADIVAELRPLGRDSYKKILLKHGATEPCLGVKIEDLQKIRKRIKKNYSLALDLFATGIYDAQYLAGLIADDARMTRADLQNWLGQACPPIAGVTVASVAAGTPVGWELALEWIDSRDEKTAATGWATLSSLISVLPDSDLNLTVLKQLLQRVQKTIHGAPNDVRYQMNGFVIAAGCFVLELTPFARQAAAAIGRVSVDMGDTACAVPFAPDYIQKVQDRGSLGKKRKSAKC